ncbi:MAG: undecaprenyl-diphosphate phosphatase [Chloroflexi bacterium]|nr:undecaprenyl-diphosphate phosphatase [Chloroflexota bacterium]MCI0791296.1 undecaprenyl-diphosphate phosphatase [Chloroflexota bacterium]MCI0795830.1 undecaprenyl-diphosphate phosphatase [Chloroflexota bacterium]MCI0823058.1 undecaprenyl-diphosphate phosphatase [Chloroflexota bacterium]MCI0841468.1 undecaprenyl-diphosphate phosphatase [Chloroflexota bacterium]
MLIGVMLGILQGVTEWLPVSSEGVVSAFYGFVLDRPLSEAVAFALWLHMGTVLSVLVVFWRTLFDIARDVANTPKDPPRLFWYLLISTLVSVAIGFPMLLMLDDISERFGAAAMGIIGLLMFITGGLQLRRRDVGTRTREDLSIADALVAGVAQGFAALPGLSRSGLTVAALLTRGIERREALVLSFLMSVPVSLGAALFASRDTGLLTSGDAWLAMGVAAVVGLASMKALLAVADRINFALFVIIVGAAILAGATFQWLT